MAGCESAPALTAPSGTLQVVSSASVLRQGDTAVVTATSAGAPAGSLTWTSSNGNVATVSAAGVVTGRQRGRVTITATGPSGTGSAPVRVVPNFAGTWRGPLFRTQLSCAAGSGAAVCQPTTAPAVLLAPATITLVQTGGRVTGTIVDGVDPLVVVLAEGRVTDDDVLSLEGTSVVAPFPAPQRQADVAVFRASLDPTLDTLTGTFGVTVRRITTGASQFDHSFQAQFRDMPRR